MSTYTNAQFVTAMKAMFASDGWRIFLKPRVEQLRQQMLEEAFESSTTLEQVMAMKLFRAYLDEFANMETQVEMLELAMKEEPDVAKDVVESEKQQEVTP